MPTVTNCTFVGNTATYGGAISSLQETNPVVTNCVLWENSAEFDSEISGDATVTYSCIQDGETGAGNIDLDPMFVDADGADDLIGTEDDDWHLLASSPCINAGHNPAVPEDLLTDIDGQARIQECQVDMGADETPWFNRDCNGNSMSDACDIDDGVSEDCNANRVPDECETGSAADCNNSGVPDLCDIHDGTSQDCDDNGVPDECELADDCNGNGVPDECDIAYQTSLDWDHDGVPDECQEDCNENGLPDFYEVLYGLVADLNGDGVPDECEAIIGDANCDGLLDFGDIDPFVMALVSPSDYAAAHADCDVLLADVNGDGAVNFGDIDPFVALLVGG